MIKNPEHMNIGISKFMEALADKEVYGKAIDDVIQENESRNYLKEVDSRAIIGDGTGSKHYTVNPYNSNPVKTYAPNDLQAIQGLPGPIRTGLRNAPDYDFDTYSNEFSEGESNDYDYGTHIWGDKSEQGMLDDRFIDQMFKMYQSDRLHRERQKNPNFKDPRRAMMNPDMSPNRRMSLLHQYLGNKEK